MKGICSRNKMNCRKNFIPRYLKKSTNKLSIRNITYASYHFNLGMPLKTFDDFDMITGENGMTLEDTLTSYCINGNMSKYIGDIIVKKYKENDPKMQALWVADISRKHFIVRCSQDGKCFWLDDKKAGIIKEKTFDPVVGIVNSLIKSYYTATIEKNRLESEKSARDPHINYQGSTEHLFDGDKVIKYGELIRHYKGYYGYFESGKVYRDVMSYIAPHFILDKFNRNDEGNVDGQDCEIDHNEQLDGENEDRIECCEEILIVILKAIHVFNIAQKSKHNKRIVVIYVLNSDLKK